MVLIREFEEGVKFLFLEGTMPAEIGVRALYHPKKERMILFSYVNRCNAM